MNNFQAQDVPNGHSFLAAGTDLAFRRVEIQDATPTGAQLAAGAGFRPAQQATVLHFLPSGELEDIRPTETVTLTDNNQQFIIVEADRIYRFTVDGQRFDWPAQVISGATVRKVAKVPDGTELLLDRVECPDRVVGLHDMVDLAHESVEAFKTRKRHWEINVQGVLVVSDAPSIVVRDALMQAGFNADDGWQIFLKVHGQPKELVTLTDTVDLRRPGIEKLRLTPNEVGNGEAAPPTVRVFALLDADEEYLDRLGLRWETLIDEGTRRWLLIHDYPVPPGYTVIRTLLALEVPPTYPQAALYGFYAYPPLALASGRVIDRTQMRGKIRGEEFHGWSRHRGAAAWDPAKDNVVTQLALVDEALAKEVGQ